MNLKDERSHRSDEPLDLDYPGDGPGTFYGVDRAELVGRVCRFAYAHGAPSAESIAPYIESINDSYCVPPLEPSELVAIMSAP